MANGDSYRRKFKRIEAPFLIKIITYNHERVDGEYCACAEGMNISPCGLSFKYPKVIEKGDHMRVLIRDINGMKAHEIMANIRIIWAETKDMLSRRFGGRFVKISSDDKYKLMKLVRQNGGQ